MFNNVMVKTNMVKIVTKEEVQQREKEMKEVISKFGTDDSKYHVMFDNTYLCNFMPTAHDGIGTKSIIEITNSVDVVINPKENYFYVYAFCEGYEQEFKCLNRNFHETYLFDGEFKGYDVKLTVITWNDGEFWTQAGIREDSNRFTETIAKVRISLEIEQISDDVDESIHDLEEYLLDNLFVKFYSSKEWMDD